MKDKSYAKLADLLSDSEWSQVCDDLKVEGVSKESFRKEPQTVFQAVSKTTYCMAVFGALTRPMSMLAEVAEFLGQKDVRARTTASVISLADNIRVEAQQLEYAISWTENMCPSAQVQRDLEVEFRTFVKPFLLEVRNRAAPQQRSRTQPSRRRVHLGEVYERIEFCEYSREALDEFEQILRLADNAISDSVLGEEPADFPVLRELRSLSKRLSSDLRKFASEVDSAYRTQETWSRAIDARTTERFKIFIESVSFLHQRTPAKELAQLLRLDVFRHRPQLYEMWVMCTILKTLRDGGCNVQLLEVASGEDSHRVWNLKYAKATSPVAEITKDDAKLFLFYQLFRRRSKGDMPDISLWRDRAAETAPVWIVDPKFSEKGGYSMSSYVSTAQRYMDQFRPSDFSCVLEYFPRPEIGSDSRVILDVAPRGAGLGTLRRLLKQAHGLASRTIAILDLSSSYVNDVLAVAPQLRRWVTAGELSDTCILFAGNAKVCASLTEASGRAFDIERAALGTNSSIMPALAEALRFSAEDDAQAFILLSDGDFDDGSMQTVSESGLRISLALPTEKSTA
ncbi:hypothetical protein [Paraburkholderia silvatlantica]|uniref:VWA domain-containing protein n=1 Tax=Paraburkholderia silvatlantica TaxID=321895 RepID=A0ABR6FI66_9BURK|nr:hypothetical protein [Paraburkholderia silvatlantica]MBB2927113.1 hypothetical protein [Paraburkholderia silvatlantica]PVY36834.1 hypothetical protein C7411_102124 [Paraburkholderia silvatlantica]PXW41888.1 hypothetical protein C7413_102297 [Paraburkholderia silvatlantica]